MLPSTFAATLFPGWHSLSSITREYLEDGLHAVQLGELSVDAFVADVPLYLTCGDVSERVRAWVRDTTQSPPGLELHRAYAESAGL